MSAEDRQTMSVGLTCKDMKASVGFYREKLGFEMKESWPDAENPMWANMVLGGQSVMLGQATPPEKVGEMCAGDEEALAIHTGLATDFRDNLPGAGVTIYLQVPDIDAYFGEITGRGVETDCKPKTEFYGIRNVFLRDPDGYRLVMFTPVTMESCQSCGMPLTDAEPGQMYCDYCTDEEGKLRPFEQVFEGTVTGFFMGMQKMDRESAEKAATEHLSKMPAWAGQ
ncbi:MAG TPA: hypothetical protein ENJ09_13410 [Planctomycetes bacterium]|nr:hypothetical protein [Planctomycetota bacterium]